MGCSCSTQKVEEGKEQSPSPDAGTELPEEDEKHKNEECNGNGNGNGGDLIHQVSVDCESGMKIVCRKRRWALPPPLRYLIGRTKATGNLQREAENNAWLLANLDLGCNAAAAESIDISSVNSSFRFSFGSQFEMEPGNAAGSTVLLVNLEKSLESNNEAGISETHELDFQWMRLQSLERQILPAVESLIRFSYEEIRSATSNFSHDKVLGRGAHSCVYRGRLRLGRWIAVKRLDCDDKESDKAFCRELHIASSLRNRHVVPLLGFCIDRLGLFLVYKFISGGSLQYHLHDKKGKGSLSCSARLRVAIGIAKAIDYLHHGTQKCVVHRDIKPSNILLSSRKTAKLCDFGLATWTLGASVPFLCKTVKGTFGYLAPEYFQHGKVSEKTDTYAFGVVLLELITGRKPIEAQRPSGDENLVAWARPLLYKGMAEELVDPRMKMAACSLKKVERMMQAAAVCLHPMESWRPCMSQVLRILNGHELDSRLIQHARLTLLQLSGDSLGGEEMKVLKAHLALAMVGVDLDVDDENGEQTFSRYY